MSDERRPVEGATQKASDPDLDSGNGLIRSMPPFVWLTSFTMFVLVLLGTLVLPYLLIPDEKHHADMALMAREGTWIETGWPGLGERRLDPAIVAASLSLGPREAALRENRAGQHPPLFYLAAAVISSVVTFPVDNLDLELHLWSFRLTSVITSALLPLTFYLIASEVTTDRRIRLSSAVVPLLIPGITLRDGAMINNDSLLILLTSLSTLYAIRVAKGELAFRTGIGLGLATGLAVLTKGSALLMIPVIVVAYLLQIIRDRRITQEWLRSVALSGGVALVVGGWWWIRNLVVYGVLQPLREVDIAEAGDLDWMEWLTSATQRIVGTFWGGQFALGGQQYQPLFWVLTILLVLGVVVGWARSRPKFASSVSGMYGLLLIAAVLVTSAILYADRGRVAGAHGRYLFPGLSGAAPLAVLAVGGVARRAIRWLPALFVSGSVVMTLLAVGYMFHQYWQPFGSGWDDQWSGVVASSPLPEAMPFGILFLTLAAFLTLVAAAVGIGLNDNADLANPALSLPVGDIAQNCD